MISHAWTVVCEKCVIDQDSNNVFLDVLERLTITATEDVPRPEDNGVIMLPARFTVVSLWYRDDPEVPAVGTTRSTFVDPTGRAIGRAEIEADLRDYPRSRTRMSAQQLPYTVNGTYFVETEIEVEGGWQRVARVPLELEFRVETNE